jgi:hypothetical protein
MRFARRLETAAEAVGVTVVDHLIVATDRGQVRWRSLASKSFMMSRGAEPHLRPTGELGLRPSTIARSRSIERSASLRTLAARAQGPELRGGVLTSAHRPIFFGRDIRKSGVSAFGLLQSIWTIRLESRKGSALRKMP